MRDRGPFDAGFKPVRKGEAQIRPIDVQAFNNLALQATSDGFNFGELRLAKRLGGFLGVGKRHP